MPSQKTLPPSRAFLRNRSFISCSLAWTAAGIVDWSSGLTHANTLERFNTTPSYRPSIKTRSSLSTLAAKCSMYLGCRSSSCKSSSRCWVACPLCGGTPTKASWPTTPSTGGVAMDSIGSFIMQTSQPPTPWTSMYTLNMTFDPSAGMRPWPRTSKCPTYTTLSDVPPQKGFLLFRFAFLRTASFMFWSLFCTSSGSCKGLKGLTQAKDLITCKTSPSWRSSETIRRSSTTTLASSRCASFLELSLPSKEPVAPFWTTSVAASAP
mmetsp:Transcript_82496/g.230033  ORF Transcript_82496/g.230033 Transcript_82496/m.230033 type:complete len:265 (-) Transcript_82496:106-900(-)